MSKDYREIPVIRGENVLLSELKYDLFLLTEPTYNLTFQNVIILPIAITISIGVLSVECPTFDQSRSHSKMVIIFVRTFFVRKKC